MVKIVWLSISSWVDYVPHASHYHARLHFGEGAKHQAVDLMHKINSKEAIALNKRYRQDGVTTKWEPGDEASGFPSPEAVKHKADDMWREKFPDGEVLLVGFRGSCDPCEIIAAVDDDMYAKLDKLWQRAEEIGHWEGGNREMEALSAQWARLIE